MLRAFFISSTFIRNARLILAKNLAEAKQHPKAELLLNENYSFSLSTLSSKSDRRYSKKCIKSKCVCFDEVIWLMTMKMRPKMKNRSNRSDINRPRPRHGYKYLSIMMAVCIKQHVSNIWNSIHGKNKRQWGWIEKNSCL